MDISHEINMTFYVASIYHRFVFFSGHLLYTTVERGYGWRIVVVVWDFSTQN